MKALAGRAVLAGLRRACSSIVRPDAKVRPLTKLHFPPMLTYPYAFEGATAQASLPHSTKGWCDSEATSFFCSKIKRPCENGIADPSLTLRKRPTRRKSR